MTDAREKKVLECANRIGQIAMQSTPKGRAFYLETEYEIRKLIPAFTREEIADCAKKCAYAEDYVDPTGKTEEGFYLAVLEGESLKTIVVTLAAEEHIIALLKSKGVDVKE